jgi:hypothetical protein
VVRVWWTWPGSNRRPHRCERCALPAELHAHGMRYSSKRPHTRQSSSAVLRALSDSFRCQQLFQLRLNSLVRDISTTKAGWELQCQKCEVGSEKRPGKDMAGFRINLLCVSAAPTSSIRVMQGAYARGRTRAIRDITDLCGKKNLRLRDGPRQNRRAKLTHYRQLKAPAMKSCMAAPSREPPSGNTASLHCQFSNFLTWPANSFRAEASSSQARGSGTKSRRAT